MEALKYLKTISGGSKIPQNEFWRFENCENEIWGVENNWAISSGGSNITGKLAPEARTDLTINAGRRKIAETELWRLENQ